MIEIDTLYAGDTFSIDPILDIEENYYLSTSHSVTLVYITIKRMRQLLSYWGKLSYERASRFLSTLPGICDCTASELAWLTTHVHFYSVGYDSVLFQENDVIDLERLIPIIKSGEVKLLKNTKSIIHFNY